MAFSIELAIIAGLVVGALGGFVNSIAAWLSGTDAFNTRKNIKAILTGVFAGVALAVIAIGTLTADMSFQTMITTLVMIFLSAAGVDQLTSRLSGMVSTRTVEKLQATSVVTPTPVLPVTDNTTTPVV